MHPAKKWHNEVMGNKAVEALKRNDFGAVYVADAAGACQAILSMIPPGSSIGFGTSMTVRAIGILDQLREGNYRPINPPWDEDSLSREDRNALRRQALVSDVFLTGSNSITLDGKLVNTDATGNRVAAMIFGPKKTILVAGVNKIVRNVDEALERVSNIATPPNARRLMYDTPCSVTGLCNDCRTPGRICKATVILHRKPNALDLTVVLVGEDQGF